MPLDNYEPTQVNATIQAMPDAEVQAVLDGLEAAIKQKRQLGQLKEALQAVADVALKVSGKAVL